jgi:TolA-binding protein
LSANPSGSLSAIALLGVAASRDAQDKADLAASAYQQVISQFPLSPGVTEAQFALGCIAERQNKLAEAKGFFDSVVRSTMGGSLAQEASVRASELQARLAASARKPAAPAQPLSQPVSVVPTPVVTQPAAKP